MTHSRTFTSWTPHLQSCILYVWLIPRSLLLAQVLRFEHLVLVEALVFHCRMLLPILLRSSLSILEVLQWSFRINAYGDAPDQISCYWNLIKFCHTVKVHQHALTKGIERILHTLRPYTPLGWQWSGLSGGCMSLMILQNVSFQSHSGWSQAWT